MIEEQDLEKIKKALNGNGLGGFIKNYGQMVLWFLTLIFMAGLAWGNFATKGELESLRNEREAMTEKLRAERELIVDKKLSAYEKLDDAQWELVQNELKEIKVRLGSIETSLRKMK